MGWEIRSGSVAGRGVCGNALALYPNEDLDDGAADPPASRWRRGRLVSARVIPTVWSRESAM